MVKKKVKKNTEEKEIFVPAEEEVVVDNVDKVEVYNPDDVDKLFSINNKYILIGFKNSQFYGKSNNVKKDYKKYIGE